MEPATSLAARILLIIAVDQSPKATPKRLVHKIRDRSGDEATAKPSLY
jgi:hypothetical protein